MRPLLLLLLIAMVASPALAADELEAPACAHVDARSKLQKLGWPRAPHQGGRDDALSFAVAETLSLRLGAAITPLDFDRYLASGVSPETAMTEIMKRGPCSYADGPPDDIVFSKDLKKPTRKLSIPKTACDRHPAKRLKPAKIQLAQVEPSLASVDHALAEDKLPVIFWDAPSGRIYSTIEARRLSPEADACEWLVRTMNGPFCDTNIHGICEDGAVWVSRDMIAKSIKAVWEIR